MVHDGCSGVKLKKTPKTFKEETKMYENMTSKDLRELCKERGIAYNCKKDGKKHTMTKEEMVAALYDADDKQETVAEVVEAPAEIVETVEEETEEEVMMQVNEDSDLNVLLKARMEIDRLICEKQKKGKRNEINETYDENYSMYGGVNPYTFMHTRNKERYIEEAEVGTLIAFLDDNGKPRTAALVNRSSKRRVLLLKTEFDWEFKVPYDNVLWVKQGTKWAYGIYRILKGYNPNGKCIRPEVQELTEKQ